MKELNVTVSIPDPSRFEEVVQAARKHGLKVQKAFPPLGIATGAVEQSRLGTLRALPGVGSVEEERIYRTSHPA